MLRRPVSRDPLEMRTDPLWEFGSFGCTGCHRRNLLNPRKMAELEGSRLAFAQGGNSEIRLVHVTPPVKANFRGSVVEASWRPAEMPLQYDSAPFLVSNHEMSHFPLLMDLLEGVRRHTPVARFASKFRSRRRPLPVEIGRQVIATYQRIRNRGAIVAKNYVDALPFPPAVIDQNRKETYNGLLDRARL